MHAVAISPYASCALARWGLAAALVVAPSVGHAQLRLTDAQTAARRASPELRAAREAVAAAAARERQAGAFLNPTLTYGREQTSRSGQISAQDIAQLEQSLEIGGQRRARRDAATLRNAAADARLAAATAQVNFDVARAFAQAIAADGRARLAEQTIGAFSDAQRVSERRLAAGDVSGYVVRRLRLEVARYAAVRAAATLDRRARRVELASLLGRPPSDAESLALPTELLLTTDSSIASRALGAPDSLIALAQRNRADVRAAALDAAAGLAEARLVSRERVPTPTLSAGYKGETLRDSLGGAGARFGGFVAGLTLPLPLFDRRGGAMEAAAADARRLDAETEVVRRRAAREITDAIDALHAAETQRAALAPHLGEGARVALRAVQASYVEGEITLAEWLDAVRAYQEAESTYLTLQADVAIGRAALERAVGAPLTMTTRPDQ
jgi:outer membrane protein, heavy metal efflux system